MVTETGYEVKPKSVSSFIQLINFMKKLELIDNDQAWDLLKPLFVETKMYS